MKLEIIMVGTCELCGFQVSSSDLIGVRKKIKECEDRGRYPFKFSIGDRIHVLPIGLPSHGIVTEYHLEKQTHNGTYLIRGVNTSENSRSYEWSAEGIEKYAQLVEKLE